MARSRAAAKPNIVVIWGDDIGMANLSCYTHGLMGYQTPNIDRIAQEGMRFTDLYAEQSCTAGRSSFITGQHGLRTGLTKVGLPAAPVGLHKEDPTIAARERRMASISPKAIRSGCCSVRGMRDRRRSCGSSSFAAS